MLSQERAKFMIEKLEKDLARLEMNKRLIENSIECKLSMEEILLKLKDIKKSLEFYRKELVRMKNTDSNPINSRFQKKRGIDSEFYSKQNLARDLCSFEDMSVQKLDDELFTKKKKIYSYNKNVRGI